MSQANVLAPGAVAPHFAVATANGGPFDLADRAGAFTVVYFYPKANTSGCTTEALGFQANRAAFLEAGADIVGISADKAPAVLRFAERYFLEFPLIADPEHDIIDAYGVRLPDKNSASRVTFLVAPDGTIDRVWAKVKAAGHAEDVLAYLQTL
jgi:peroxiredoxin Q/BCP